MSQGRRYVVSGRVQGVWFRESTRQQAQGMGLSGHALNLPDGTVEVIAFGDTGHLDRLERWLHEGPPMAQVASVAVSTWEGVPWTGFRTGWSDGDG